MKATEVWVVGGGLAGVEASWQLACQGIPVKLFEMRPKIKTEVHQTEDLAELVCSNSFRSNDDRKNAVGLIKWEMRFAKGLVISTADNNSVPAGSALGIDRKKFSTEITTQVLSHPLIELIRDEFTDLPKSNEQKVIMATGPLTSEKLTNQIQKLTKNKNLAFFDAIAPIVYGEDIDFNKCWFQSRYDKGEDEENKKAYINCPMNKAEYQNFIRALRNAERIETKDWEKNTPYFNGCLPIEVMADRGEETLRFGPMKPVGLTNSHKPEEKPYAVVQLRREDKQGELYNIVGFQTKMVYQNQKDIFRSIPGLEKVKFARFGGLHRNTFLNSPEILDEQLRILSQKNIRFAGQITGVEGYVESAAIGLMAGKFAAAEILGKKISLPPPSTAIGALLYYITTKKEHNDFQPMNVNFGLFPKLDTLAKGRKNREDRYIQYSERAKRDWTEWFEKIS